MKNGIRCSSSAIKWGGTVYDSIMDFQRYVVNGYLAGIVFLFEEPNEDDPKTTDVWMMAKLFRRPYLRGI